MPPNCNALGYASRGQRLLKPVSLAQLRQQLSLQLQTSLEVDRILGLFFQEVQRLVPLNALSYQLAASDLRLDLGERANHSAGYRLSHEGEYLGELTFRRNQRFSDDELGQLESLLASLLFPLRNALLYRAALQSALRDPLTDTGNRIAMNQALQREVDLARRNLQPLSVLMLDIDHFKSINDRFGHATGDEVLKAVATVLKDSLRNIDMVFRYGGEEFLVLLSNTSREAAPDGRRAPAPGRAGPAARRGRARSGTLHQPGLRHPAGRRVAGQPAVAVPTMRCTCPSAKGASACRMAG